MKVCTLYWGFVEAHYWRDRFGGEGLYVEGLHGIDPFSWSFEKSGPPPILLAEDLSNPQEWGRMLSRVLASDVEDGKFPYMSQRPNVVKVKS